MAKKTKGFRAFDELARKLVSVPIAEVLPKELSRARAERLLQGADPDSEPLTPEEIDAVVKFATMGGKEGGMKSRKAKPKKLK